MTTSSNTSTNNVNIEEILYKYRTRLYGANTLYELLNGILYSKKITGYVLNQLENLLNTVEEPVDNNYYRFLYDYYSNIIESSKAEARRRRDFLLKADKDTRIQKEEIEKCRTDIKYWINNYCYIYEPRNAAMAIMPMKLFPVQETLIDKMYRAALVESKDLLVEKSRSVGASWCAMYFFAHRFLFSSVTDKGGESFLCTSMTAAEVDKLGDLSTLMEKVRFIMKYLPKWMKAKIPGSYLRHMKLVNPNNASSIIGTATRPDVGRSGRYTAILIDEAAAVPYLEEICAASSQSTHSRFFISTPRGTQNYFYQMRQSGNIDVVTIHWTDNPYLDNRWYEYQKKRLPEHMVAQELDICYDLSTPNRVFSAWSENMHLVTWKQLTAKLPQIKHPNKLKSGEYVFPKEWNASRMTDWAFGTGKSKNVTLWFVRAPEDTYTVDGIDVSGRVFLVKEYIAEDNATPRKVATAIRDIESWLLRPEQVILAAMSHEAATEREIFNEEYELNYVNWKIDYFVGISRINEYLEPQPEKHPFKDLMSAPLFFAVVADKEEKVAKTSDGLARFRYEIANYRYDVSTTTNQVEKWRPLKVEDDAMDCFRAAALEFPPAAEISKRASLEKTLPENIQAWSIAAETNPVEKSMRIIARQEYLREQEQHKQIVESYKRRLLWRNRFFQRTRIM